MRYDELPWEHIEITFRLYACMHVYFEQNCTYTYQRKYTHANANMCMHTYVIREKHMFTLSAFQSDFLEESKEFFDQPCHRQQRDPEILE